MDEHAFEKNWPQSSSLIFVSFNYTYKWFNQVHGNFIGLFSFIHVFPWYFDQWVLSNTPFEGLSLKSIFPFFPLFLSFCLILCAFVKSLLFYKHYWNILLPRIIFRNEKCKSEYIVFLKYHKFHVFLIKQTMQQ